MGRARKKHDNRGPLQRALDNERVANDQSYLDVITPEMAAKGCYSAENKGRRYFRVSHLDRLHKAGKLTFEQHEAGKWYRDEYDRGAYDRPASTDYSRPRGDNVVQLDANERRQDARNRWRMARIELPHDVIGLVDRLLLHDRWPQSRHQNQRKGYIAQLRKGLDALVRHLRLG